MGKRAIAILAAALLATFALAACGGDDDNGGSGADEDQITSAIDRAATSGDPAACTDVQTPRFVQQTNGGGSPAQSLKSCQEDAQDSVADSVDVSDIEVDGNTATAKAAVKGSFFNGQTLDIALVKQGDQWKLDRFTGFVDFDKDAMIEGIKGELEKEKAPAAAIECVEQQFEQAPDQQVEDAFTSNDPEAEQALFGPCEKEFQGS